MVRDVDDDSISAVDGLLAAARARFRRLDARSAAAAVDDGAVLVDVRTEDQRRRDGVIPGAAVVSLNVLEWRADSSSAAHDAALGDAERLLVVLCAEGYSSSLAAARLLDIGRRATDVIGGFGAWRDAGLPVVVTGSEAGAAT